MTFGNLDLRHTDESQVAVSISPKLGTSYQLVFEGDETRIAGSSKIRL